MQFAPKDEGIKLNFQTKAELVYSALRNRILTGEYPPGARVPISKVARELGVSAVPVREGIKRLEAEGLLRFETHKGATVTMISAHEIEDELTVAETRGKPREFGRVLATV